MEWGTQALYDKSRIYMARAHEQSVDSSLFAIWASLSLELLLRAALAKVHPVLLADPREDGSILYAFGIQPAKPPRSIVTKAIVVRCQLLVDGFTKDMAEHCAFMADRRNSELHSGVLGFDTFDNSAWLPSTYEVIEILLRHLGYSLVDFLGRDHATTAEEMLRERGETIKQKVLDRISAAKKAFEAMPKEERTKRIERWEILLKESLKKNPTFREVTCPACKSAAIMAGDIIGRGPVRIDESNTMIEREVRVLPTKLLCRSCDLKLDGFQQMRQAHFGTIYKVLENEDPIEFFGIDPSDYINIDQFMHDNIGPEYDNE